MCEVFLLRDLGPFEIEVRGSVTGDDSAAVLAMVIEHLPDASDAVVDLRDASRLDSATAHRLVELLESRLSDGVCFVVVADDPWDIRLLIAAGISPSAIVADRRTAQRALSRVGRIGVAS